MKAAATTTSAGDAQAKATSTSDADEAAFTLGASVLVGGVKSGRLRYIGGVHFVGGQWCGVELDDADGLHDGLVDGVRYFTCRDGHGIFAPRHRVALRHAASSSSALPGPPDVRMRALRRPTANVVAPPTAASADDGDVDRLFRVRSPQHRHKASLDGREFARPTSAAPTDDDLSASMDSTRKRSSLVTGRLVSSSTPRASPKRVTFFDEIISSKERGVPSAKTDVDGTDGRQRGHDDSHSVNSDARSTATPAYVVRDGSPSRKMSRIDAGQRPSSAPVYDLDNVMAITNALSAEQELSLSSDSIEASEIDSDFAAYGLASFTRSRLVDVQYAALQSSASKSPKTRVDEALNELELMAGRQQNPSLGFGEKPSRSGQTAGRVEGSTSSSATMASFELARTALTQYADLVRAAEESSVVRQTWTPPAVRRTLPTTPSSAADQGHRESAATSPTTKDLGVDGGRLRRVSPDGGSSGGSVEEVDFETFDGEDLDSIGDAMIDSIDGSSVQSEDSIAMLPHLSDVDDDDTVDTGRRTIDHVDPLTAQEQLIGTTCNQVAYASMLSAADPMFLALFSTFLCLWFLPRNNRLSHTNVKCKIKSNISQRMFSFLLDII